MWRARRSALAAQWRWSLPAPRGIVSHLLTGALACPSVLVHHQAQTAERKRASGPTHGELKFIAAPPTPIARAGGAERLKHPAAVDPLPSKPSSETSSEDRGPPSPKVRTRPPSAQESVEALATDGARLDGEESVVLIAATPPPGIDVGATDLGDGMDAHTDGPDVVPGMLVAATAAQGIDEPTHATERKIPLEDAPQSDADEDDDDDDDDAALMDVDLDALEAREALPAAPPPRPGTLPARTGEAVDGGNWHRAGPCVAEARPANACCCFRGCIATNSYPKQALPAPPRHPRPRRGPACSARNPCRRCAHATHPPSILPPLAGAMRGLILRCHPALTQAHVRRFVVVDVQPGQRDAASGKQV
jgi:hypothetical protein